MADPEQTPTRDESGWLDDLGFGFGAVGEEWLDHLREAETPMELGRIGDYELLEEVSRGGQGVVFRARQPGTNRPIALKRLLAGSLATRSMQLRFQREVEAAAALSHPNIVTAYGVEEVDGQPLFAMEWVDGQSATDWAAGTPDGPRRDPRELFECFARMCDAIQHAHSRGVLHRDLKPSNVLVDAAGQPHVLDFGLAKLTSLAEGGERSDLTGSSDFLGTPAYASPEQLRAEWDRLDERTDVYSLGVLLFEMLTGESPYPQTRSPSELVMAVETLEPPRPSGIDPRLSREVDTIVRKALAKERDDRYGSVADFGEDIRRHLAGRPITALEPSSWYLVRKLVRRNRLAVSFAATVLVLVVGFAFYALWQTAELQTQRDDAILAWEEAELNRGLAQDAANVMESMFHRITDQLQAAGVSIEIPAFFSRGTVKAKITTDCPKVNKADRNPYFDPEKFRRTQLPVDDPGPLPGARSVGP